MDNVDLTRPLRQILANHGISLLEDPGRLEGLMRDAFGGNRREVGLLVSALRAGIPQKLMSSSAGSLTLAQLQDKLVADVGLSATSAEWAVQTWAQALDIGVQNVPAPAPPQARDPVQPTQPASTIVQPISSPRLGSAGSTWGLWVISASVLILAGAIWFGGRHQGSGQGDRPSDSPSPASSSFPSPSVTISPELSPTSSPSSSPSPATSTPGLPQQSPVEQPALTSEDVRSLLEAWLATQDTRDFTGYSALYDESFTGVKRTTSGRIERFNSREAWLRDRRPMLLRAHNLQIQASDVKIALRRDSAQIAFHQIYTSDAYSDEGDKILRVARRSDRLLITYEELLWSKKL